MLAPLTRITDATRMAANGSLSHRIRLPGRRDEFRELADAFDAMLARLEAHVAEQQRFAANASHELRTPLAITQTLLDVARNDPNRDTGELVDRLHAVNTRAIDLTEALLLLSRADQRSFTREHVDLSLIAEEATETLLPLAEKRGVTIETSGDMTPTIGSHALLLQMTTNLVHNAIVHNLPEQGTVWVTTSVHPKSVVLTVENTGEKLTPQLVSTLVEPFQRGTERIRTDHAGVGLGLAIVKSITQAHDGTLTLTPRAAGGLRVTVQLPAAPPHPRGASRRANGVGTGLGLASEHPPKGVLDDMRPPAAAQPVQASAGDRPSQGEERRRDCGDDREERRADEESASWAGTTMCQSGWVAGSRQTAPATIAAPAARPTAVVTAASQVIMRRTCPRVDPISRARRISLRRSATAIAAELTTEIAAYPATSTIRSHTIHACCCCAESTSSRYSPRVSAAAVGTRRANCRSPVSAALPPVT